MKFKTVLLLLLLSLSLPVVAQEKTTIRLGVLAFGTVNWELAALSNENLDKNSNFIIKTRLLASPQAGKIALQSGAVDMIVSDWIWVSRQRSADFDFTFYPYSNTAGSLMVPADSAIRGIADLQAVKLGIAGGELDKNWLLLQALASQQQQLDLNSSVEKAFAAPPLLNQQMLRGKLDAVMTYWHYGARLEAQGYRKIIDGNGIINALGIKLDVPRLGYVFNKSWGEQHRRVVDNFLDTVKQARDRLCSSDSSWQKIAALTKAENITTETLLRERYCQGRVKSWGVEQQQAAEQIYRLLKQYSQNRLTGASDQIQPGTFWDRQR